MVNTFYKKTDALTYYLSILEQNPSAYLIAQDYKEKGQKKFLVYQSYDNFMTEYEKSDDIDRCHYEVIDKKTNTHKVKLFFDIDVKNDNDNKYFDTIEDEIENMYNTTKTLFPDITKNDFIVQKTKVQNSGENKKKSYHIVLNGYYFEDYLVCKDFVFKHYKEYIDMGIIDKCVYRIGCYRMLHSSKLGRNYPLFLDNDFHAYENVGLDECLVAKVENCKMITHAIDKKVEKIATSASNFRSEYNDDELLELFEQLNPKRYNNYQDTLNIAICLYSCSTDENNGKYLDFFINQCKKHYTKWDIQNDPEKWINDMWRGFNRKEMTQGSLIYWLNQDGVKITMKKRATIFKLELCYCNMRMHSIAILMAKYIDLHIINYNNQFFIFQDGTYKTDGLTKTYILKKYIAACDNLLKQTATDNHELIIERCKKIGDYIERYSTLNELFNFMIIDKEQISMPEMNKDRHLLGFKDGILNIKTSEFYENNPNMMVSWTTGWKYADIKPYINNREVDDFFSEKLDNMFENEEICAHEIVRYGKSLMSAFDERFDIVIGGGCNGKGVIQHIISKCLGDYFALADSSTFENARNCGNETTSDLMALKNKRIVFINENSKNSISSSTIKKMASRELITGRQLYKETTSFIMDAAITLFINPPLPCPDKIDGGIMRRIFINPYNLVFCENPRLKNERLIDVNMKTNLPDKFYHQFLAMLILASREELPPCKLFDDATKHYKKMINPYNEFISDCIKEDKNSVITLNEFKGFLNENKSLDIVANLRISSLIEKKNMFDLIAKHFNKEIIRTSKCRNVIPGLKLVRDPYCEDSD